MEQKSVSTGHIQQNHRIGRHYIILQVLLRLKIVGRWNKKSTRSFQNVTSMGSNLSKTFKNEKRAQSERITISIVQITFKITSIK